MLDSIQNSKKKYAFLIIYLGKLPQYFTFWARTCEFNHEMFHWYIYNDHIDRKYDYNKAVTMVPYNFYQLRLDLKNTFDIDIPSLNTRIVCDCRIMLYPIRKEMESLDQYDFIGYSDIDMIYGDIENFLPQNAENYSIISGHDQRPCGPFTLFNRKYLEEICFAEPIKIHLENDQGKSFYNNLEYSDSQDRFKPMSGNTTKDKISEKIKFSHWDESMELISIAEKFAPSFCRADPLQPTMTKDFNHRKAIVFWENGNLFVQDNLGRKKEGGFFHFSRFKNKKRFKIDPRILEHDHWGIYKYGPIALKSNFTRLKMYFSLLY